VSKYLTFTDVVFPNLELLRQALAQLGYPAETHELGTDLVLYGYQGDARPERARLVIRRRHLTRASNDLGFARTEKGYVPLISEYDQKVLQNGRFLADLQLAYHELAVEQIARRLRGTVSREQQGHVHRIRIRY